MKRFWCLILATWGAWAAADVELVRCEAKNDERAFVFAFVMDPPSIGYVFIQVTPPVKPEGWPLWFPPKVVNASNMADGSVLIEAGKREDLRTSYLRISLPPGKDPVISFRKKDHSRYNANSTNLGPPPVCVRTSLRARSKSDVNKCAADPLACAT